MAQTHRAGAGARSEVQQAGWTLTLPLGGTQTVSVTPGQALNLTFGNRPKKRIGGGADTHNPGR